jgi:hypothetical protein
MDFTTMDGTTANELTDNMFGNDEDEDDDDTANGAIDPTSGTETISSPINYYQGGSAGGGKLTPILEPENASFFIVRSATYHDLAISAKRGEWYFQTRHAIHLNNMYINSNNSHSYNNVTNQIMIFFTVSESDHIQGAALVTSPAIPITPYIATSATSSPSDEEPFTHKIHMMWYRELKERIFL